MTETSSTTTITNGYNSNGSLITKTQGSQTDTYSWDVRGRMIGSSVNGVLSSYQYTPDGIRSAVTGGSNTTLYIVDEMSPSGYAQVVEELTTGGALLAQYVYCVGLDASAVFRPDQGGGVYLSDGHSGIRQVLNGAGTVVWSQRYDAFGNAQRTNPGSFTNTLSYCGERFDATLGQYNLRARYYDPRAGRFTGMDPFGGNYGDPLQSMRYGYAGGNPIGGMDPSGKMSFAVSSGLALGFSLSVLVPQFISICG